MGKLKIWIGRYAKRTKTQLSWVGVERIELSASRSRTEHSTDELHPGVTLSVTITTLSVVLPEGIEPSSYS